MHSGHRQRLREQFEKTGLEGFSDIQVLEFLLTFALARGDVNPLAHTLLKEFGSLSNVLDASLEDLQTVPGVGEHTAVLLTMMPQLFRRYTLCKNRKMPILNNSWDIAEFILPYFLDASEEQVYLICLDGKRKVLDCRRLSEGGLNAVSLNVRKVVETAIRQRASVVILAHNHPWGFAVPSREDELATREIKAALDFVDVSLADHVIVAHGDCVSLRDSGFFD